MRVSWTGALCAVLVGVLASCAGSPSDPYRVSEDLAARVIADALQDIEEFYYRETEASTLVQAGLTAVEDSSPGLKFVQQNSSIVATAGDSSVFAFETAGDQRAAESWGERVAAVLRHVASVDPEAGPDLAVLTNTFLRGVTDSLDSFTRYSPRDADRPSYSAWSGTLSIGIKHDDAGWRVSNVFSIALLRSRLLRKGDVILEIDGVATGPLSSAEVLAQLRGEAGSPISLTLRRPGESEPLVVSLQRMPVEANTAGVFAEGAARRMLVTRFGARTVEDARALLRDKTQGPQHEPVGIIVDLRGNPGGLLEAAIEFADLFLAEGRIVETHGRHRDSDQYFSARTAPTTDLPLVVLIDEGSAAGSEIVAAALQAHGRAVVIGSASSGAGTIQTVLPLPNGGDFLLTWAEVSTPDNYQIQGRGVMPTVCTSGRLTAEEILGALRSGGGVIDRATRIRDIDPEDTEALEAFRALCPPRSDGADIDVGVAQALLHDPELFSLVLQRGRGQGQAAEAVRH